MVLGFSLPAPAATLSQGMHPISDSGGTNIPTTVTVGNNLVTFQSPVQSGALGNVNGEDSTQFNLETGQAGIFLSSADLQLTTDSQGNMALAGDLEPVANGQQLPSPSPATVTASPGQLLLVLDGAGNYVLVQIQKVSPSAVYFSYVIQSGISPLTPSQSPTPSPSPGPSVASGTFPGSLNVGTTVVTFQSPVRQGALGNVNGEYANQFNLETGQAGINLSSVDLQLTADSQGNVALEGALEPVQAGQPLSSPSSAVVSVSPGQLLLVLDQAGNYALVAIQTVSSTSVTFDYVIQSGAAGQSSPPPAPSSPPTSANPSPGSSGASANYPLPVPLISTNANNGNVQTLTNGTEADQTTIGIAQVEFPNGVSSHTVVLASGSPGHLVDSLTAGPLAYQLQAPLLMTQSDSQLGSDLAYYLQTNQIQTVYLVGAAGGADAAALAAQIQQAVPGAKLIPLTGSDRAATAAAIAGAMPQSSTVFVASAEDAHLVDAVAASPAAALLHAPILLDTATAPPSSNLLQGATTTYVIGAAANYTQVNAQLPGVVPIVGATRNQTAVLLAQRFFPKATKAVVASGDNSDLQWTLDAGPLAAKWQVPLLLAEPGHDGSTVQYLAQSSVQELLVGGQTAQNPSLMADLQAALNAQNGSPSPAPSPSPTPNPAPAPNPTPGPNPTPSPAPGGASCAQTNHATITAADGSTVLDVTFAAAQNPNTNQAIVNVTVSAPSDVSSIRLYQSGQYGDFPWVHNIPLLGQVGPNTWAFDLTFSDYHVPVQVEISSPTLTAAGYNPAKIVWIINGIPGSCSTSQ